ncbi:MAG: NfeD family protein [Cyanothece sp. SIO1E1]|nr:NfeD family protein [Cyanothece sp. SIO1E1]
MSINLIFWLVIGVVLCLMELFVPTAFVESTLGISALIVALFSLVVPQFNLQVLLWMVLSGIFIVLLRRFVPRNKIPTIADATEAQTLTEILPGQTGRVLYEGNSWRAQCEDEKLAIAPNQQVYVVGRKGNTLLVLPESLIRS